MTSRYRANVSLKKGTDIILADEINVVRGSQITCLFDLPPGATKGKWDVVVINPNGQKGTLPRGFDI